MQTLSVTVRQRRAAILTNLCAQRHVLLAVLLAVLLVVLRVLHTEGQGKGRKLSITLVKQPAHTGQRYTLWDSLLVRADAPKSPDRRDQAAKLS